MIGYVAKDKDGSIYLYQKFPVYDKEYEGWCGSLNMIDLTNQCSDFDDLKYTDEPIKVEIKLERI